MIRHLQPPQKKNSKAPQSAKTPPKDKTKKEDQEPPPNPIEAFFVRLVLSLKRINVSYTQTNSTTLPGFTKTPTFIGENTRANARGYHLFLATSPMRYGLLNAAASKGWITNDTQL